MSIASRISTMYDHVEDIYDTLSLGGDTTTDKNIVNINTEIKREYKDFLANGTDTLWNNWEKVSGTGESLSLSPTIKGKMQIDLKGNTYQNGAPTPDSPIPIQVVSGNNSITISNSDNTESQTLQINLGTIELCKIGDYQDYIYKSSGKWYVHKEIGKNILDGTQDLFRNPTNVSGDYRFYIAVSPLAIGTNYLTLMGVYCNKLSAIVRNDTYLEVQGISYSADGEGNRVVVFIEETKNMTNDQFKTWLGSNNLLVYYVLKEATNTEITDTTLIEQLNNIEKAYSYNDTTNISQINNDMPFIITASALKEIN